MIEWSGGPPTNQRPPERPLCELAKTAHYAQASYATTIDVGIPTFTEDEIILAARSALDDEGASLRRSRGVTLPSQLRKEVRRDGRKLLELFRKLAIDRKPVSIQRWSLRRLGLTLWVLAIAALLAGIFFGNLSDIGLA